MISNDDEIAESDHDGSLFLAHHLSHHGEFFPGTTLDSGTEAPSHAWSEIELPRSQCAWTKIKAKNGDLAVTIGFLAFEKRRHPPVFRTLGMRVEIL